MMMTSPSSAWSRVYGESELNNQILVKEVGLVVMILLKIPETDM
jgi:hypothetical protein